MVIVAITAAVVHRGGRRVGGSARRGGVWLWLRRLAVVLSVCPDLVAHLLLLLYLWVLVKVDQGVFE